MVSFYNDFPFPFPIFESSFHSNIYFHFVLVFIEEELLNIRRIQNGILCVSIAQYVEHVFYLYDSLLRHPSDGKRKVGNKIVLLEHSLSGIHLHIADNGQSLPYPSSTEQANNQTLCAHNESCDGMNAPTSFSIFLCIREKSDDET